MNPSKITDLKAFLPAKDLAVSKQFYLELGFHVIWDSGDACELEIDNRRFILTSVYVKDYAENCMMSLNVEDTDSWWEHITRLELQAKYKLGMAKPPALQPWGLRVLYLSDPSGVLWHIADRPKP